MGAPLVVTGAQLTCSMGAAPGVFTALPVNRVLGCSRPVGTVDDRVPFLNVAPFGMCRSPATPAVATAQG